MKYVALLFAMVLFVVGVSLTAPAELTAQVSECHTCEFSKEFGCEICEADASGNDNCTQPACDNCQESGVSCEPTFAFEFSADGTVLAQSGPASEGGLESPGVGVRSGGSDEALFLRRSCDRSVIERSYSERAVAELESRAKLLEIG